MSLIEGAGHSFLPEMYVMEVEYFNKWLYREGGAYEKTALV